MKTIPAKDQSEAVELSRLQLALLVLYGAQGSQGASPYGIERFIKGRVGGVLGFSKSACYEQSKKLAEAGYLSSLTVEGARARPLTLYFLTTKGRRAIKAWLQTPVEAPPIDSEVWLRCRAGHIVQPGLVLDGLRHVRPILTARLAAADAADVRCQDQGDLFATLELELVRLQLQAYLKWLTKAEKTLKQEVAKAERAAKSMR